MTALLLIERAGVVDLDEVMEVMEDSFDPAFGEAWTSAQCAGILPMKGVWMTLGRSSGGAVGFTLARIVADEAELLLLAVRREFQRRGMGRRLLEHFTAEAARRGAARLHLEVRDGNPAAGLYGACGFSEVGRRSAYYRGSDGHMYDALTLARPAGGL